MNDDNMNPGAPVDDQAAPAAPAAPAEAGDDQAAGM